MASACWSTPPPANSPAAPTESVRGRRANHAARAGRTERAPRRASLGLLLALPALALAAPVPPATAAAAKPACTIPDAVDPEHYDGFCAMPAPIRAFVARQDTCTHFAGEEPYDAARRRELEQAMAKYCGATNRPGRRCARSTARIRHATPGCAATARMSVSSCRDDGLPAGKVAPLRASASALKAVDIGRLRAFVRRG